MKRSDVQKDIGFILDELKENDYEIPNFRGIYSPINSFLKPLYWMVLVSSVFSFFYHGPREAWLIWMMIVCNSAGLLVINFFMFIVMYNPNRLLLCLSDKVKSESILCNKWYDLTLKYRKIMVVISLIISVPLTILTDLGYTAFLWSWFVMVFCFGVMLNVTFSQYLTPEIIDLIKKIRGGNIVRD